MKLYSFATFNLTKILLLVEELGIDCPLQLLDARNLEHKSPEHLKRHPLGKVPAIEVDDEFIFESNAICRLLCELNGNRLYGDTPLQRARVNQWTDFMTQHIGRHLTVFAQEELLKPRVFQQPTDSIQIAAAQKQINAELIAVEEQLARTDFLAGSEFTMADAVGFSYCQIQEHTSVDLRAFPNVQTWYQRIKSRPSFAQAMARLPDGKILPFL